MHYMAQQTDASRSMTCRHCGLTTLVPVLSSKQKAHCPRCDHTLTGFSADWVDKILALSCSALFLLILSLSFSFLSFDINGMKTSITLASVVATLADQAYLGLAILIFIVCIILPASVLLMLSYWTLAIKFDLRVYAAQAQIKLCFACLKWCMPEVWSQRGQWAFCLDDSTGTSVVNPQWRHVIDLLASVCCAI